MSLPKHSTLLTLFRSRSIFSLLDSCDSNQALGAPKLGDKPLETSSNDAKFSADCTTIVGYGPKCTSTAAKGNRGHIPPAICLSLRQNTSKGSALLYYNSSTEAPFVRTIFYTSEHPLCLWLLLPQVRVTLSKPHFRFFFVSM